MAEHTSTKQPYNILIIDDDEFDRENLCRLLNKSSLSVNIEEATNSDECYDLLSKGSYDCLLLDYLLPPTNGLDLIRELPEKTELPATIMLTGMGDEEIAVQAIRLGIYDYLPKDKLTPERIENAILQAIGDHQSHQQEKHDYSELKRLSYYDDLTKLPNRHLLKDRINEAIKMARRQQSHFAVLFLDLNGFKAVNDDYGHHVGDWLLRGVSERLIKTMRDADTVARLGGDEFVIVLSGGIDFENTIAVANKLHEAICIPFAYENEQLKIGVSIGVVLYPDNGDNMESLLQHADEAMYAAKKSGTHISLYQSTNQQAIQAINIANDLNQLIDKQGLFICFQPQINLLTNKLYGAEVLVRWMHPKLGLLSPKEFIPIAEKSTLIRDISYRIFDLAIAQQKVWVEQGLDIPLSLNISGRLLTIYDFINRLDEIRNQHGLPAKHITLEITESALISEQRRARKILELLAENGYLIAIDDFGTGYSSLTYLRDFPIHEIKIDQTFVLPIRENPRNGYIFKSIVGLASAFNTTTVAEGIETSEIQKLVTSMGCHIGQGFNIGKPMQADEFMVWNQHWNAQNKLGIDLNDQHNIKKHENKSRSDSPVLSILDQTSTGHPYHFLISDDNDIDREWLIRVLSGIYGHAEFDEADTVAATNQCLDKNQYDCLLLDYRLPDGTGLDVLKYLQSGIKNLSLPVIMLTGAGNEDVAVQSLMHGAVNYLRKEKSSERLFRTTIDNAIRTFRLRQKRDKVTAEYRYLSFTDSLTGLNNRRIFFERLLQASALAKRESSSFSVLILDFDRFSEVNKLYGHSTGDYVLKKLAGKLKISVRESDTIARIGGDEFAAILFNPETPDGAIAVAQTLIKNVTQPIEYEGLAIELGVSVGVVCVSEPNYPDIMRILEMADEAMCQAKQNGGGYALYNNCEEFFAKTKGLIGSKLPAAIKEHQLILFAQPWVDLKDGVVKGAEILVRWQHPERGMVPPMKFIPIAEKTSIIQSITLYVLEQTLQALSAWRISGDFSIPLTNNLSTRMLSHDRSIADMLSLMAQYDDLGDQLVFEVTESIFMENPGMTARLLREIRDQTQARLAIDNFGAGYTSLQYLRDMPIDFFKIDSMFVQNLKNSVSDSTIIRAICELGQGLDAKIVAEGVEKGDVIDQLVQLGCHSGQGYYFAKPMPLDELPQWVREHKACVLTQD